MIKVDVNELATCKAELDQEASELETLIQRISQTMNKMPQYWEGQAALAYQEQYQQMEASGLRPVLEMLQGVSTQVQQVCANAEQFDQDIANQIR